MEYRDAAGRGSPHPRRDRRAAAARSRAPTTCSPTSARCRRRSRTGSSLLRAMRVNVDPIWGLSLGAGLTDLLEPADPARAAASDDDGIVHALGAIDDPDADRRDRSDRRRRRSCSPTVTTGSRPRARTATSCRAAGLADDGADAIMCFVVELVDDELTIEPIHRLDRRAGRHRRARRGSPTRSSSPTPGPITPEARRRVDRADGAPSTGSASSTPPASPSPSPARTSGQPRSPASTRPSRPPTPRSSKRWSSRGSPTRRSTTATTRVAVAALVEKGAASAAILCSPVSVAQTRAPPRSIGSACRRRRPSSGPSRAPAWSSARSTDVRRGRSG